MSFYNTVIEVFYFQFDFQLSLLVGIAYHIIVSEF